MTYQRYFRAASDDQVRHMIQARFMLGFLNTRAQQGNYPYADIVQCVNRSHDSAGGPALRLANAVWDLEYALRFPKSKTLRLREEASFAGLYNDEGKLLVDAQWHVGKAMRQFVQLRNQHREQVPMAMLGKEELELPERQALVRLFWLLWAHRHQPYVQKVIKLFLQVNPVERHHFVPQMRTVAGAISAFEEGKKCLSEKLSAMNSILRQQWVKQTEVGDAIGIFQVELDQRLAK